MAQNLQLDPVKKDYIIVNGSPVPSDRVEEASYYALNIPENKWLYGVGGQGSLIYTLQNIKRTSSLEQTFAAYATDAINRQVIAAGKATNVKVVNTGISNTGSTNTIGVVPASIQLSDQLNFVSV